jgi:hypothetical protein
MMSWGVGFGGSGWPLSGAGSTWMVRIVPFEAEQYYSTLTQRIKEDFFFKKRQPYNRNYVAT